MLCRRTPRGRRAGVVRGARLVQGRVRGCPAAVGGGSSAQLGTAPKPTMACTSASKAPPASRLLTVASPPRRRLVRWT